MPLSLRFKAFVILGNHPIRLDNPALAHKTIVTPSAHGNDNEFLTLGVSTALTIDQSVSNTVVKTTRKAACKR